MLCYHLLGSVNLRRLTESGQYDQYLLHGFTRGGKSLERHGHDARYATGYRKLSWMVVESIWVGWNRRIFMANRSERNPRGHNFI